MTWTNKITNFSCARRKKCLNLLVMCVAGCQDFAFHKYKDTHENRLFASYSNGSVSFQLAQTRVGDSKVPVSIVLYINDTFIKKAPQFDQFTVSTPYIVPNIIPDIFFIIPDITPDILKFILHHSRLPQ